MTGDEGVLQDWKRLFSATADTTEAKVHGVDRKLRVLLANRSLVTWCRKLGVDEHIVGKRLPEAFPFVRKSVWTEYRRVVRTGRPEVTEELTVGSRRYQRRTMRFEAGDSWVVLEVLSSDPRPRAL